MSSTQFDSLYARLPEWSELDALLQRNLGAHGDFPTWRRAVQSLPKAPRAKVALDDTVTIEGSLSAADTVTLRDALQVLHPWRKGPFSVCGVRIDSEWRSDYKWRRVAPHIDLRGKRVLDVGCGNGYYGWRMLGAGAHLVVGIDPTALYAMQHRAINHFVRDDRNQVLPLALEALPETLSIGSFDAVFSMGVIYHRRDPLAHLRRLRRCLVPGGLAVVESLTASGDQPIIPNGRYARMRNVWQIPAERQLVAWMAECGFQRIHILATTTTTTLEQRTTPWMRFDSLADALDPADANLTVEGHPAPRRSTLIASAPA